MVSTIPLKVKADVYVVAKNTQNALEAQDVQEANHAAAVAATNTNFFKKIESQ